jgi:hypothetical protein
VKRKTGTGDWASYTCISQRVFYCEVYGTVYSTFSQTIIPNTVTRACDMSPCLNYGTCNQDPVDVTKFTCDCYDRYDGDRCENGNEN